MDRFEFIAGCPALCLVDTLGDRAGPGHEKLPDPRALEAWLAQAIPLAEPVCGLTERHLRTVRLLREAIHRCGLRMMHGEPPALRDLAVLNRAAAYPPPRPRLRNNVLADVADHPFEASLSLLAADALRLLVPPLGARIRRCPGCAMMFVDTSRPGKRRWCSSATGCGNREKVRNLRARRASREQERRA